MLDHCARLDAVQRRLAIIDADFKLGNADLFFDLEVGKARNGGKLVPELFGGAAQRIEIIAKDLEGDFGAYTGKQVIETMGDRLADIDGQRQHRKPRADVGDDFRLRTRMTV